MAGPVSSRLSTVLLLLSACTAAGAATTRVALRVPEWAGVPRRELVTSGVPLPRGALRHVGLCRLLDGQGREVPFCGTALARWPGGSVKWLLLDFPARVGAGQTARFVLECGRAPSVRPTGPTVQVAESARAIQISTGPLRFSIRRDRYTLLDSVQVLGNGKAVPALVSGSGASRLQIETTPPGPPQEENWLRNAAGGARATFTAAATRAVVEFHNPLRAVVLVRGQYQDRSGKAIGPLWTRYTAWAGSATLGIEHFFAFDADVEKAFLRTLSLGVRLPGRAPLRVAYGLGEAESYRPDTALRETALVEVMPDRFYHLVPLSVDRRVRYQVVGQDASGVERVLREGTEAAGWVSVHSGQTTMTVAMRDFARLHPKEIRVDARDRMLRYYLWPERGGKVLDLRRRYRGQRVEDHYDSGEYGPAGRGFGKTHQLLIEFRSGGLDAGAASALARRAQEPLRAFCEPAYYASCDVWNRFHPVDTARFPRTEALIRLSLEWTLRLPRLFHWDGMVDWGDTLFQGYETAPHGQVREVPKTSWCVRGYDGWLNNDCNVAHDFLLHFLRSGDDRIFRYAERMVQHIMDVDTIHAAEDPTELGGGRRHDQQHWGATYTGYGTAAVEAADLYYLTGSLWAREMLRKYADWYLVGGGAEWETRLPCLALAWEATGDRRYLDFVRRPAMREDVYGLKLGDYGGLDRPHWRTPAVELGVDLLYRATGERQWRDHLITAARRFIEANPGNQYGQSLLARAYLATGDRQILDWMRRLLVVAEPYARALQAQFFRGNQVPPDLRALSWDELHDLARKAGVADARTPIYRYRYTPYVMAALVRAGLDEQSGELKDFALDRAGMGQFHLRGPDVPEPTDAHYEPIPLGAAANCDPLADPLGAYAGWQRHPLAPGEVGFAFCDWGECEPGYLPVRPATRYPYSAPVPLPGEHDGTNLVGLPWGGTLTANNVPFVLARAADGRGIIVVGKGERASIPIGRQARRLYVLGHVCQKGSPWRKVGARYHLNYADGTTRTVELTNLVEYEGVFQWGLASRALFARNWKVQGGWDGGTPILHTYALTLEPRPLREVVLEDAGEGIGFMVLAVTAEVAAARAERPVLDLAFGPGAPGAAANRWREGATVGWLNVNGTLTQGAGVSSDGAATLRVAAPDGLYEAELELSEPGWSGPFSVRANGRLVARSFVATSGCVPGVTSRPERLRFPVRVTGGHLDLTLQSDRTTGNWRHPVRLQGDTWVLTRLQLLPGAAEPPEPPAERVYGWVEPDRQSAPVPDRGSVPLDARLQSCFRSRSPRGTFRADLPPGRYEVELLFAARGDGPQEAPLRMHVSLQGQRVLADFEGGTPQRPVTRSFPIRLEPGEPLLLTFEPAANGCEWGVNAATVRRQP